MTAPPLTPAQVRKWADYANNSPLYQHLTEVVAADDRLLRVLNRVEHQPRPNVLFAGVQFIMTRDGGGELERFYPNFTESPEEVTGIDGPFRDFVLAHEDELIEIGRTRYTQTNECRRCAALLPAIWATPVVDFHLVDFGTSAGLNLHLDRYRYRWGEVTWGPSSDVRLDTEVRGVPVEPRDIEVLSRTGLDLNPIDPRNAEDRLWLEALVWPEHHDRRVRLRAALDVAVRNPVDLVAGDALKTLGPAIDGLPEGEPVVVINSFVLNQFAPEDRTALDTILASLGGSRPIYRVSLEWLDNTDPAAMLTVVDEKGARTVGYAHPHGEWIELYARP